MDNTATNKIERIVSTEAASCYRELVAVFAKMRRLDIGIVIRQEFAFDDDDMPVRHTKLGLCGTAPDQFASAVTMTEPLFGEEAESGLLSFDSTFESDFQAAIIRMIGTYPYPMSKTNPLDMSIRELLAVSWEPFGTQTVEFVDDFIEVLHRRRRELSERKKRNSDTVVPDRRGS